MTTQAKPAEALLGTDLENGWHVCERVARPCDATGGTFSVPYVVERGHKSERERAFLKALDFTSIMEARLPLVDALQNATNAYAFERDLVLRCSGRRMSNVVRALDAGEVDIDVATVDPKYTLLTRVPYLIFEAADGDVRAMMERRTSSFESALAFRILHGVANGIRQLHEADIAHQDLKPSNVMTFSNVAKVGDLGRASPADGGPFDHLEIAGDYTYAPPELLYHEIHPDDRVRRRATDLYHLGSLAVFFFAGAGLTTLIEAKLHEAFHWRTWPRDYRNALPYVRDAFDRVIVNLAPRLPGVVRGDFVRVVRELADPDPLQRGSPSSGSGTRRYFLDRYVSAFDLLARRSELSMQGSLKS